MKNKRRLQQQLKKNEKRQQKQAQKEASRQQFLESANREYLSNKQSAEVLDYHRQQYMENRDKGRTSTEIRNSIGIEDDREVGALIKQYWDYVDRGLIKAESGLSQYEIAEFMSMEKTPLEMQRAIEQADAWREKTEAKEQARLEAHREWAKNVINF